MRKCSKNTLCK